MSTQTIPLSNSGPAPLSPKQQAHVEECTRHITQEIEKRGDCIGFDRYMQLALHDPSVGYYHHKQRIFGKDGDFCTVPEISIHLAYCLAHACARLIRKGERWVILEIGAGSGRLAHGIITHLNSWERLPVRYYIHEPSSLLCAQQKDWLTTKIPRHVSIIKWLSDLSVKMKNVIIIANEVLDALPVKCFEVHPQSIKERCVGLNHQGDFDWQLHTPSKKLETVLNNVTVTLDQPLPEGYRGEINLGLEAILSEWVRVCERCVMFLIDYGYPQSEYYHPQRSMGTLRGYFNHQISEDPLAYPGLQDITADVDFSALAKAAERLNLKVLSFGSQRNFMLANHLLDWQPQGNDEIDHITQITQLKQLTLGSAIGERFQVMVLGKGIEHSANHFTLRDMRARL